MSKRQVVNAMIRVVAEMIAVKAKQTHAAGVRKKKRRRVWVKKRNTLALQNSLDCDNSTTARVFSILHINEETFNILLQKVAKRIQNKDTVMRTALPAKLKLQVVLHYLATGDSISCMDKLYNTSPSTISKFLPEVALVIDETLRDSIEIPQNESQWKSISDAFESNRTLPNCVGVLVGKRANIHHGDKSKQLWNILIFALIDDNANFMYVDVDAYEFTCPSEMFAKSNLLRSLEDGSLNMPGESFTVGSSDFPLKTFVMTPYVHSRVVSQKEAVYNDRHSRAIAVGDKAFRALSDRFHLFKRPISISPDTGVQMLRAACALHNWIRKSEGFSEVEEPDIPVEESPLSKSSSSCLVDLNLVSARQFFEAEAINKRDMLATQLFSEQLMEPLL